MHPSKQPHVFRPMSFLNAVACLNCGELRLYARDLPSLRQLTQEHPEWFTW